MVEQSFKDSEVAKPKRGFDKFWLGLPNFWHESTFFCYSMKPNKPTTKQLLHLLNKKHVVFSCWSCYFCCSFSCCCFFVASLLLLMFLYIVAFLCVWLQHCWCFCCCCCLCCRCVIIVSQNNADFVCVVDIFVVVADVVVLMYISINFLIFLDPCSPESDWPCAPPVLPYTDYGNGKLRPEPEFAFTSHIFLQC